MTELEQFLRKQADKVAKLDKDWPDVRRYSEDVNPDAIDGDAWLNSMTSYIWKVGVLAQWDSNKFDHARLFIGHEREPGSLQYIGCLYWEGGENDDIGRSLERYVDIARWMHPVFEP